MAEVEYLYGFEGQENDLRRKSRSEKKSYEIQQLWQRQHEIIRMALVGMSSVDIAKVLDITPKSVSMTLNSPIVKEKLSMMRAIRDAETIDVAKDITRLYKPALETYEKILTDDKVSMALKKSTADTIVMDIGGHRAPTKVQGQFMHGHLTAEQIADLVKRGREAAQAAGMLTDGEIIDVTAKEAV